MVADLFHCGTSTSEVISRAIERRYGPDAREQSRLSG
jgi:hypothetical protein